MIVENSVGRAEHSLAVSVWIPREPDARLHVVRICLNSFLNAKEVVAGLCQASGSRKLRREFHVVAHARVQGKVRPHSPGVLPVKSQWFVGE